MQGGWWHHPLKNRILSFLSPKQIHVEKQNTVNFSYVSWSSDCQNIFHPLSAVVPTRWKQLGDFWTAHSYWHPVIPIWTCRGILHGAAGARYFGWFILHNTWPVVVKWVFHHVNSSYPIKANGYNLDHEGTTSLFRVASRTKLILSQSKLSAAFTKDPRSPSRFLGTQPVGEVKHDASIRTYVVNKNTILKPGNPTISQNKFVIFLGVKKWRGQKIWNIQSLAQSCSKFWNMTGFLETQSYF